MKIVVLGGSGFIGGHIVDRLAREGHDVLATYHTTAIAPKLAPRSNVQWWRADLREGRFLFDEDGEHFDVVIHCAAVTSGINDTVNRPEIHVADNVLMNTRLVKDAVAAKVKHFIFLSSSLVYNSEDYAQAEDDVSYYFGGEREKYFGVGWMKIYAEKMMEFYAKHSGTRFTVLRPANIYGPGDKFDPERSHVMGATIRKFVEAERKGESEITMWGDGDEARDFLYISDLVDCVKRVVGIPERRFDVFNVGTGQQTSIRNLARLVIDACQTGSDERLPFGITFDPSKPSGKTWLSLDSSKASSVLDWRPKVSMAEGILETYKWCKKHY